MSADSSQRFEFKNKSKSAGEIWVYGIIGSDWLGEGITANTFRQQLTKLGAVKTLDLHLNSDGGSVTDAQAMYNLLVQHEASVTVHIDGIAASAASFLAMAGDTIRIAEGGLMMVHNARAGVIGDANKMRQMATTLDLVNATIVDKYQARTKKPRKTIQNWMDAETWFDGKQAVAEGFADVLDENLAIAACISPMARRIYRNIPARLRPRRMAALNLINGGARNATR